MLEGGIIHTLVILVSVSDLLVGRIKCLDKLIIIPKTQCRYLSTFP